jgi:hypothetical protein
MTYVAKDLGISDVMLGKMCKEQLVMNCDECGQSIHWIDSYA